MRRVVVVAMALATTTAACAAVLGLRDIDEVDSSATRTDGAPGDGMAPDDAPFDALVADARADGRSRPSSCDRYPNALLCDDFEEGDAASPAWRTEFQGGGGRVAPRPSATDAGPYPNLQDFAVGFQPIPDVGKAALAFDRLPSGKRSLRFSLWIPEDAYPAHLPVGGLIDATGAGIEIGIDALIDAGLGRNVVVRDTRLAASTTIDLGYVAYRTWTCIEVELSGDGLRAWQNKVLVMGTVSAQTTTSALTAEVGLTWRFGGGPDSTSMHYDDVVIANGAIGCD